MQGMGKGCGASMPSPSGKTLPDPPCVHQSESSLNPILWGFYGGYITWARLINH